MLDLARLRRIHLSSPPRGQQVVAAALALDYRFPRRTEIVLEGVENLPQDRPVFLAMNHTDRYNYWPFQYALHAQKLGYTATWVKGKYYQNRAMAWFMDQTGNIPLPSRGFVVASAFQRHAGRPPTGDEYRALRDLVDGKLLPDALAPDAPTPDALPPEVLAWTEAAGGAHAWAESQRAHFAEMMAEVMRITREGMQEQNLHVLVFPEGTRRSRLGPGHTGLVQVAWHLNAAIVPVGCNGSDQAYPRDAPFSKGGRVVYRIGRPLEPDGPELGAFFVKNPYTPFTVEAGQRHGQAFRAGTNVVMDHIQLLLDPRYQREDESEAPKNKGAEADGASRFL
jgi:1-acyl-sn-glycerol-3-phosphate acyltransferase